MTKQQTIKEAMSIINKNRQEAERLADYNYSTALKNKNFKNNEASIADITIKIAKKEVAGESVESEQKLLDSLEKEKVKLLKTLKLTPSDIVPNYSCKKCNDKGIVNNKYCTCLENEINKILMKGMGLDIDKTHTFENCDDKFLKENSLDKIYATIKTWVNKYPDSKFKNFTFLGKTGTGKTYLTECIANALIKKYEVVNFVTAFNLNEKMLAYHTTFDDSKASILEPILNCSTLIIDDLGTEPMLKNVTKEYLYLIINERALAGKSTIVTSNLTQDDIIKTYGERIYSRLFNKTTCITHNFTSKDLRVNHKK